MNKKVQVIRGLAIIAVILIHTNIDGIAGVITRPFMNFAVATFIFLSGYLTKLDIPDIKSFYKKRLQKVAVPYIIWSIIYTIASSNYNNFFVNFITGRCCAIFYYIFVYSFFVFLTPIISKMIQSKFSWVGCTITPISIFITRYILAFAGIPLPGGALSFLFTNWFVFYYFGMYIGNKKIRIKMSNLKSIILLMVSILASIAEGLWWYYYGNYDMATTQLRFTSLLTSLCSIVVMCKYIESSDISSLNSKVTVLLKKVLIVIGNCSFGIYLSHMLIINVLYKVPIINTFPFPLFSIIVLLASVSCVLLGKRILGKKFSWVLGL